MNERIKELAEQSIKESGQEFWWLTNNLVIEKFAELIVRECIEINKQELAFNAFELLMNKYQDRFGVVGQ